MAVSILTQKRALPALRIVCAWALSLCCAVNAPAQAVERSPAAKADAAGAIEERPENHCETPAAGAFPPARVVEIDAHGGPIFGALTNQAKEVTFLRPKEVVLTFDDGPMPWITRSILDTLDTFCAKATFFTVGRMALAYPDVVRETARRGHTLASHTMTHPFNMHRMPIAKAEEEIERGFAATSAAAGAPIAPFFRFPGLADSGALLEYLQRRGIAAFTVDIVSNDSYIAASATLAQRTIAAIERANGGIVLFHDIKRATAKALPNILEALQQRGYRIVHLKARLPVAPRVDLLADYSAAVATSGKLASSKTEMMPFYGRIGPTPIALPEPEVTRIAPEPRRRSAAESSPHIANSDGTATRSSPWKARVETAREP